MLLVIAAGAFAFSEIMYNPIGSTDEKKHEWVELVNCFQETITIAVGTGGFRFFDGAPSLHIINEPIQGSRTIPPGGVFVLADDAQTKTSTFFLDYPNFSGTVFDTATRPLTNSATLEFRDEGGAVLARVTYDSSWGGENNGKTIEKENPCDGNPNAGWRESSVNAGTPGLTTIVSAATPSPTLLPTPTPIISLSPTPSPSASPQPTPTPAPAFTPTPRPSPSPTPSRASPSPSVLPTTLSAPPPSPSVTVTLSVPTISPAAPPRPTAMLLNEVVPSPSGPDTEAEYIELFNPTDAIFDLSGWFLDDGEGGSVPYQMPPNTFIQPRSYFVLTSAQTKIALNNSGDSARLLDEKKVLRESVVYGKAEEGFAYGKDATGQWRWTKLPTSGGANTFVAALATKAAAGKTTNRRDTVQNEPEPTVEFAPPSPFAVDLNKILPSPQSLTAKIVSSDARVLVLAGSIAVSFGLLLVFARRFL